MSRGCMSRLTFLGRRLCPRFPASGAVAYTVVGNEGLDAEIIRRLIGTAVYTVDHYFPAMMSIIYGNELPEDAIRHVEQSVS